ncbi:MAG: DUF4960 domain-containing protein [Paludibacteraceae bacterium]
MKNYKLSTCQIIIACLASLLLCTGCKGHIAGNLDIIGDCLIETLVLDEQYAGTIDASARTVTVYVPEGYSVSAMVLSSLSVSEGATADVREGDSLNMLTNRAIVVTNGDVYLEWTLIVRFAKAQITSFVLNSRYVGGINQEEKTIRVYVPSSENTAAMTPVIKVSDGAVVTPESGVPTDFSAPVAYTVTNQTLTNVYTVYVDKMDAPAALFVGTAATIEQLLPEERRACDWMLAEVEQAQYCSLTDFANGKVELSACKVIWWHFHRDGGVDGKSAFESAAPEAVAAVAAFQKYIDNGGTLLLSRYATYLPGYLSLNGNNPTDRFPNNCWGGNEESPETTNEPWSFFAVDANHPLFAELAKGTDPATIYTCDAGYRITNSTAQWHIGDDWGGYPTLADFEQLTHAQPLAKGGDGAVVVWEYAHTADKPAVLCIGTGCYDWYSIDEVYAGYHSNIDQMTLNAINYLTTNL